VWRGERCADTLATMPTRAARISPIAIPRVAVPAVGIIVITA
jgi:hypothetical protein